MSGDRIFLASDSARRKLGRPNYPQIGRGFLVEIAGEDLTIRARTGIDTIISPAE